MFLTVTLNPALDKTLCVERNPPRDTIRATRVCDIAGGKGVNVARGLLRLEPGGAIRAFMPLGGFSGAHVAELARKEGMEVVAVPVSGQTRTAITIDDAETRQYWHYLEPGPLFSQAETAAIQAAYVEALSGCGFAAVSGSLPSPEAAPLLPWMVARAKEHGVKVALDCSGAVARVGLEAGPWLAKPNVDELRGMLGEALETEAERWSALERLANWGVEIGVLSNGSGEVLVLAHGTRYRIEPPRVTEVSDLGSGDAMVAGILWSTARGYNTEQCLAWGAACGAANAEVWDPCGFSRDAVERLLPDVKILEASRG